MAKNHENMFYFSIHHFFTFQIDVLAGLPKTLLWVTLFSFFTLPYPLPLVKDPSSLRIRSIGGKSLRWAEELGEHYFRGRSWWSRKKWSFPPTGRGLRGTCRSKFDGKVKSSTFKARKSWGMRRPYSTLQWFTLLNIFSVWCYCFQAPSISYIS